MRAGDRGLVRFRFLYNAELITPNTPILLREGNAMIIGKIATVDFAEK
jgi:GTPase